VKKVTPISVDNVEKSDTITLWAKRRTYFFAVRNCDGDIVAGFSQVIGEVVHVHSAVGAKVMVKNKEDIVHPLSWL
jgi:hypothetical protein